MSIKITVVALLSMAAAMPALAQDRSTRPDSQPSEAMSRADRTDEAPGATDYRAARRPTTQDLNHASNVYTRMRAGARNRYRMDRRAYIAAINAQHDRAVRRYGRRYVRQQIAYADAMAAWRHQVAACHRGNRRACSAPTPRVSDFY